MHKNIQLYFQSEVSQNLWRTWRQSAIWINHNFWVANEAWITIKVTIRGLTKISGELGCSLRFVKICLFLRFSHQIFMSTLGSFTVKSFFVDWVRVWWEYFHNLPYFFNRTWIGSNNMIFSYNILFNILLRRPFGPNFDTFYCFFLLNFFRNI